MITLLVTLLLLSSNVFATSVTKSYNPATKIAILHESGFPLMETQLLSNTDQCLIDCEAVIRIKPSIDIQIPSSQNPDFNWVFRKSSPNMLGLESYSFEILQSVPINVPYYVTTCNPYNTINENGTTIIQNCTTSINYHIEYRDKWVPFNFWNEKLEKNKDYHIKLKGKKYASSGRNDVEWIPTFYGIPISEWAWWSANWTYKMNIALNTTSMLTDFPYLLNGTGYVNTQSLISAKKMQPDCDDIRITNATEQRELAYEFESFPDSMYGCNASKTVIWVASNTSDTERTNYFYYNNSNATVGNNTAGVWDSNFALVYHFGEGVGTTTYDSSINNNHGAFYGTPVWNASGVFGYGVTCDGSDDYIKPTTISATSSFTVEAWVLVRQDYGTAQLQSFVMATAGVSWEGDYQFDMFDDCFRWIVYDGTSTVVAKACREDGSYLNKWYYVAGVINSTHIAIYLNGTLMNSTAHDGSISPTTRTTDICNEHDAGSIYYLNGNIDEVRISYVNRSAEYISQTYRQRSILFSYFGAEERYNTPPTTINVTIIPSIAYANDSLNCSVIPIDNEQTSLNVSFVWHKNGMPNYTFDSYNISATVNNLTFTNKLVTGLKKGDNWTCYAQAFDGYDNSSWVNSSTIAILNSPPNHTNPLLISTLGTNFTTENLTCYNKSTYDTDSDTVINIYNWYKNNQPLAVLNMPFEGSSNSTFTKDYSGYGNNGNVISATWSQTGGIIGGAYQFDGVDDYIDAGNDASLRMTTKFTIEAWLRWQGSTNRNYYAISKGRVGWSIPYNGYQIRYNKITDSEGYWTFDVADNDTQDGISWRQDPSVANNVWYHIVATFDSGEMKIYGNGVLRGSKTSAVTDVNTINQNLRVGMYSYSTSPSYAFNGTIDEVRIYNKALTPQQIKQRYEETKDGLTTNSTIVNQETTPGETYYCQVTPNDGEADGLTKSSTNLTVVWAITFNVTDSFSGIGLNYVSISCDYPSFVQAPYTTNPYGPYGFLPGIWLCSFVKDGYYDKTVSFITDSDKAIDVKMSERKQLTIEEHTWLEFLYNCWSTGECRKLLENINTTTTQIWQRVTGTNRNVITQENVLSYTLNSTSNITINYTINVPYKEGVPVNEPLPIRLYFWFTNPERTICYSQDKAVDTNRAESPYCLPLVAETLGPNNGTVSFRVDLRPNLTAGAYNITRSVEIDPVGVWTQYGREDLGTVVVSESGDTTIKTYNENRINFQASKLVNETLGITGAATDTGLELLSGWQVVIIIGIIAVVIIVYIVCQTFLKVKKK